MRREVANREEEAKVVEGGKEINKRCTKISKEGKGGKPGYRSCKAEEPIARKLKCKGVNPVIPKLTNGGKAKLSKDLMRMGCGGLMGKPWHSRKVELLEELARGPIPSNINGTVGSCSVTKKLELFLKCHSYGTDQQHQNQALYMAKVLEIAKELENWISRHKDHLQCEGVTTFGHIHEELEGVNKLKKR